MPGCRYQPLAPWTGLAILYVYAAVPLAIGGVILVQRAADQTDASAGSSGSSSADQPR
jgi:hypothetical protein